jgi:MFS family permease
LLTTSTEGVFGGVLISEDFQNHFPEMEDANISGITSSCFSLGAFFGCLFAFAFGDRFGRKKTIFIGITCNVCGVLLS